jgi:hypothetical protein
MKERKKEKTKLIKEYITKMNFIVCLFVYLFK